MKNNYKKKHIIQFSSGFTLVELLAAIAIFGVIMVAVSGIFMNAIREQRIALARQNVADNALYAMEFMIKELRMARSIATPGGNGSVLVFENSAGSSVTYSLVGDKITRNDAVSATGDQPISSGEIVISDLNFNVNAWDAAHAPRVTIFMRAQKAISPFSQTSLEMQSTAALRMY
jgi:prepilin-type N-terminal cleavage/methylation domain-containing protein